ncbi:MAG: methyltransferase [Bacteroidetes bacterium]|jgi:16S rRNA C967 or C1407 C5-methylase (RsmB/RsmF family)/NOL1/NOP2/fmu family ribosome biogenesis protein|nr:methyltransferase [Bacteroidota bacterium]
MSHIPKELIESLKPLPGFNENAFVHAHEETNRITSIRLNPFKKEELNFALNKPVPWSLQGFYLNERPSFTYDPLFHAGCYYVQEAGSMFIEHAIRSTVDLTIPLKALDLCAAPGGKSTLINSLINEESLLVSNEIVKPRATILSRNLAKWGAHNTVVTNNDPSKLGGLAGYFDVIVVDAPCSGSGLFRKQPEAIDEWSLDQVNMCGTRQKKILADILPALKEDGVLIYSTCSYSIEENETIVEWLIEKQEMEYIPLNINDKWGIVESEKGYRFYPHLTQSEGFFCAVLRKRSSENTQKSPKITDFKLNKGESDTFSAYFDVKDKFFFKNQVFYHFMNEAAFRFAEGFKKEFFFRKAGVMIGEIKGKDLIPDQELAWSNEINVKTVLELSDEDCIKFLKKEVFSTTVQNPGFSLVTSKGRGLGWVKTLQNRINNYLPNDLRILN